MLSPKPLDLETEIKGRGSTMDLEALPEGCIANILSLTTPLDAFRLSLVSRTFCSAAQSDAVWDRFLPSDLETIISEYSSLIATSPSKKALYLALSDRPVIVDHGKKSFQLDKRTGKKCFMISARDLGIIWGDTPQYWCWITNMPESRFEEVASLVIVWWFEIRGKINTLALSSGTQYAAFLVFKMINAHGFEHLAELSVGITGGQSHIKQAYLDLDIEERELNPGLEWPNVRSDGWLEIEIGEFFNSGLEDEEVEMSIKQTNCNFAKHGFFLQGIEVRPKLSSVSSII